MSVLRPGSVQPSMSSAAPTVSVIVATHDRPERLGLLLESLRAQTSDPEDFEVIVVDDGSGPATVDVLDEQRARGGLRLTTLRQSPARGPASARNLGLSYATGQLVAYTDDDCTASPGWIQALREAAAADPGAFVQGRTDPRPEDLHVEGPFSHTLRIHAAGPYFESCNIAYPRDVVTRLGGFDADGFPSWGGQDTDLAWRAMAAGARPVYAPAAQIYHAVDRVGPWERLRQTARWSDVMLLLRRHPGFARAHLWNRVFWRPSHYVLLRAALAIALPRALRPLTAVVLVRYASYLVQRAREEGGPAWLAPYVFVHDLLELAAVLRGAVRYRVVVL